MSVGMLCLFGVSFAGLVNGEREKNNKILLYTATVSVYIYYYSKRVNSKCV